MNNRYLMAKGDIYSVGQGFDYQQFTLNEEYKDRKSFYFLEQGHLLKYFLEMWTKGSLKDQLKVLPVIVYEHWVAFSRRFKRKDSLYSFGN